MIGIWIRREMTFRGFDFDPEVITKKKNRNNPTGTSPTLRLNAAAP
jgi:hypothetical protein